MALEPHEWDELVKQGRELSGLHQKLDGLYNQRFDDMSAQKEKCDAAANHRASLTKRIQRIEAFIVGLFAVAAVTGWLLDRPAVLAYLAKRAASAAQLEEKSHGKTHSFVIVPTHPRRP